MKTTELKAMIEGNSFPSTINLYQKNKVLTAWNQGRTQDAFKMLEGFLTPVKSGKTLL